MNGKLVKIKCINLGITQRELAEQYGLSYQQLNAVINGREHTESVVAILEKFLKDKPVRPTTKAHRPRGNRKGER